LLAFTLSQKETVAVWNIKNGLAQFAKDRVRYRTGKNLYCNSIEFRCYFHDPADLALFCQNTLDGYHLVRSPCLEAEEWKCAATLYEEAEAVVEKQRPAILELDFC